MPLKMPTQHSIAKTLSSNREQLTDRLDASSSFTSTGLTSPFRNAVAGSIATTTSLIACYPLDLLKNRIVVNSVYTSARECIRLTFHKEGVKGFYKGLASPVLGEMLTGVLTYGVYGTTMSFLSSRASIESEQSIMYSSFLAGTLAGIASLLKSPLDVVKIQLQTQYSRYINASYNIGHSEYISTLHRASALQRAHRVGSSYTGFIDCISQVVIHRAMLLGFTATAIRNIPGWAVSVSTFEYLRMKYSLYTTGRIDSIYRDKTPFPALLLCGGFSGMAFWVTVFPVDVIKGRLQAQKLEEKFSSYSTCIRKLYSEGGAFRFYRGMSVALVRSFPNSAIQYSVFHLLRSHFI